MQTEAHGEQVSPTDTIVFATKLVRSTHGEALHHRADVSERCKTWSVFHPSRVTVITSIVLQTMKSAANKIPIKEAVVWLFKNYDQERGNLRMAATNISCPYGHDLGRNFPMVLLDMLLR
jgi:hypothetical protein